MAQVKMAQIENLGKCYMYIYCYFDTNNYNNIKWIIKIIKWIKIIKIQVYVYNAKDARKLYCLPSGCPNK